MGSKVDWIEAAGDGPSVAYEGYRPMWPIGRFGQKGFDVMAGFAGKSGESRETRSLAAYRGWERRRERDEFVAVNVPADLLPLWERTKLQFRGTPEERLEAFLAYAHDHEGEGVAALADEADAKLEAMIREFQRREVA